MKSRRTRIAWQDGEERVQRWIDRWSAGDVATHSEPLHESPQRALYRLESADELTLDLDGLPTIRSVVVKIHRTHTGPHRRREHFKKRIGYSPALREWGALCDLHRAGVPVPEPLAWGVLPSGDPIVVTEYCGGTSVLDLLTRIDVDQGLVIIDRIVTAVRALHTAGFRHGDLHLNNMIATQERVVLLDLQRARTATHRREQLRDIAHLDFSIARADLVQPLRARLRSQLGVARGAVEESARREAARYDATARSFVRDFLRGRTRRQLSERGDWVRWERQGLSGRRVAAAPIDALQGAFDAARAEPRPDTGCKSRTRIDVHGTEPTRLVVKRCGTRSRFGAAVDRLRGSPAQRAFKRGQRLALLGRLGARPLAALDDATRGLPETSWLILEEVGDFDLDAFEPDSESEATRCLTELAVWISEWQAWGIDHRDLKAGNIRVDQTTEGFRFWLIDLADVRFRFWVPKSARIRSLVQLNASLDDAAFSISSRRAALDKYLERLPIARIERGRLETSIAERSLARQHRWRGDGLKMIGVRRGSP